MLDSDERLASVLDALWADNGRAQPDGGDDLLGLLVRMMLAQATSKANASAAFGNLLDRFEGDWRQVHLAPVSEVVEAIAVGGLASQKAPRIQRLLGDVHERFGDYTLEPMREWEASPALELVLGFDGVGPTTARFTLMAGAAMDVFPMNGGIRRMLARVGVLDGSESDAAAHRLVEPLVPQGAAYAAHMALVEHARKVCRPTPDCGECVVRGVCEFTSAL